MRVELELSSGLVIRARITKEDYARLGLEDGCEVSCQIRQFRVLAHETEPLGPEMLTPHEMPPLIGEHI